MAEVHPMISQSTRRRMTGAKSANADAGASFSSSKPASPSDEGAHEVCVPLGQLIAALEEALGGLLQRGIRHQLLFPELGEVDDAAQVGPEARRLRLVQVLPRDMRTLYFRSACARFCQDASAAPSDAG